MVNWVSFVIYSKSLSNISEFMLVRGFFGKHLDNWGEGLIAMRTNNVIGWMEFLVPPLLTSREGRGLEAESITNHQ